MPRVYVRANPGRIARVSPQGAYIPGDKFISAQLTPYVSRLASVHGDIEMSTTNPDTVQLEKAAPKKDEAAK